GPFRIRVCSVCPPHHVRGAASDHLARLEFFGPEDREEFVRHRLSFPSWRVSSRMRETVLSRTRMCRFRGRPARMCWSERNQWNWCSEYTWRSQVLVRVNLTHNKTNPCLLPKAKHANREKTNLPV